MADEQSKEKEQLPQKKEKIEFSYMFLFSGLDFEVGDFVIKHPTIRDILNIQGTLNHEEVYWSMVSTLLSDPYDSMVQLDDMGIDYQEISSFDLFCMNWENQVKLYEQNKEVFDDEGFHPLMITKRALSFFLGEHDWELIDRFPNGKVLIDLQNTDYQIDDATFELIGEYIKAINCIDYKDRVNPKSKFVKEMLIEDMREEQERKKYSNKPDEKINILGTMMSAVCVGGNGGITPDTVLDLRVFQLYKYFIIDQKKTRVDKLLNGVYAGTIDGSKLKDNEYKWTD